MIGLQQCLLLLLCISSFSAFVSADMSPDDGVKPGWAGTYDVGTRCSCESTYAVGYGTVRSMLCYNYRFDQSLAEVEVEFNCTCFDRVQLCALLPFSQSWTGSATDCEDYSMDSNVDFSSTAPTCYDSDNQDCGVLPGGRGETQYTYISPDGNYSYCRTDTVRFNCTTGICTEAPVLCELQLENNLWSQCFVAGGTCVKTMVIPIITDAANGAPPCPSLGERTQIGICTEAECAQQQCIYYEQYNEGNCSTECGPGVRNATWYNISLNSLESCISGDYSEIINQTESPCEFKLPCASDGLPIQMSCSSQGNTGSRNHHVEWIRVDFNTTLLLTATASEIINSFVITESTFGRRIPIDLDATTIAGNVINIYLFYAEDDFEPNTGTIFYVTFKRVEGFNFTIRGNEQTVPPFRLVCSDQSPPGLLNIVWYNNSAPSWDMQARWYFIFTEPVRSLSGESGILMNSFNITGGSLPWAHAAMGLFRPFYSDDYQYSDAYYTQEFIPELPVADIRFDSIVGFCVDQAGNTNLPVPETSIYNYVFSTLMADGVATSKLVSTNNNGSSDAMYLRFMFPMDITNLQNNVKLSVIFFDVYDDDPDNFSPIERYFRYPTRITYDTPVSAGSVQDSIIQMMVFFEPIDLLEKRFYPASVDSVYLGRVTGTFAVNPLLLTDNRVRPSNSYEQWELGDSLQAGRATAFSAPVVLSAKTSINSSLLYVTMSRWSPNDTNLVASAFSYNGTNSIVERLEVQNGTLVVFQMALNYTFDMILTDQITFNGTYAGNVADLFIGENSWRYRNVTLFNGTRPSVLLASISYDENDTVSESSFSEQSMSSGRFRTQATATATPPTTPNTLIINFDVAIDPATAQASDFIVTPVDTTISAVTVTSVTLSNSNKVATLRLTTTCAGTVCFNTGPKVVRIDINSITDVFGNRISTFITSTAFDLMPPSIQSVTCYTTKTCMLVFTEAVTNLNLASLVPSPVACHQGQSAVCLYAEQQTVGTEFYLDSSSDIRDFSGNKAATGKTTSTKMSSNVPKKKCSSFDDLSDSAKIGFWVMVGLDAVLFATVIGFAIKYGLVKAAASGSKSAVQLSKTNATEKSPLLRTSTTSSSSVAKASTKRASRLVVPT